MRPISLVLLLAVLNVGCARMVVKRNPGPNDRGIRFYRPKPYLFIGPSGGGQPSDGQSVATDGSEGTTTPKEKAVAYEEPMRAPAPNPDATKADTKKASQLADKTAISVTMHIEYLPDYNEEYSIRVTPGLGQASLKVSLQNGWNLNSVDEATDQKYAEILGSVASLVGAAAKADVIPGYRTMADYDVPLGYYEAVIASDERGCRQLIGWRYVGFMLGFACPVKAYTSRPDVICGEGVMFALVFEGGGLKMKRIQNLGTCPGCNTTGAAVANPGSASPTRLEIHGPGGIDTE
jgi:hypothetical protein